jgi:hypothetical protein
VPYFACLTGLKCEVKEHGMERKQFNKPDLPARQCNRVRIGLNVDHD